MAKELTAQTIFIIVMVLIVVYIVANLIKTALNNVTFWLLRPSESAALDLVSYITALGGTSANVSMEYKVYTSDITYHVKRVDKIICIIAQVSDSGFLSLMSSDVKTYNCYSTPFISEISDPTSEKFNNIHLEKMWNDRVVVDIS